MNTLVNVASEIIASEYSRNSTKLTEKSVLVKNWKRTAVPEAISTSVATTQMTIAVAYQLSQ